MSRTLYQLFNTTPHQSEPVQGGTLIANPFLQESYFQRACICLVDYKTDGNTTGLVLNKRISVSLNDTLPGIETTERIPLYCGGPVGQDRLFFIHKLGPCIRHSMPIAGGLYFNGKIEDIIEYINAGNPTEGYMKFFVGYSGWDPRQLPAEIIDKVWAVDPVPHPDQYLDIRTADEDMWTRQVSNLGEDYRPWLLCPANPSDN